MTRRNIYLLVPQKGMKSFVAGIDPAKIKVVAGRKKAQVEAERFERELNGGKTWNECLESCKSPDEIDRLQDEGWRVTLDTDHSWSNFKSYDSWPVQDKIEALLDI